MPPVQPSLAYRLRVALGRITRNMKGVETGLTWPQAMVLTRLEENGDMTAAAIAAAEGVRPQSMAATLSAMEEERMVSRRADAHDRRQLQVSITEHGRSLIRAARASKEQWLAQAMKARLNREEIETLRASLAVLERLAEDPSER
jgi:DNA-binding MarR family transcriptional regulator